MDHSLWFNLTVLKSRMDGPKASKRPVLMSQNQRAYGSKGETGLSFKMKWAAKKSWSWRLQLRDLILMVENVEFFRDKFYNQPRPTQMVHLNDSYLFNCI